MPQDLYGNELQQETPTTILLQKRNGRKVEADGKLRCAVKVWPAAKAKLIINALANALEDMREFEQRHPNKEYTFSMEVQEA